MSGSLSEICSVPSGLRARARSQRGPLEERARRRRRGTHCCLTMQSARAPAGSERVCASAVKPAPSSTSRGGWLDEVQRKSDVSRVVQRSIGELKRQGERRSESVASSRPPGNNEERARETDAPLGHDDDDVAHGVLAADEHLLREARQPRTLADRVPPQARVLADDSAVLGLDLAR